MHVQVPAKKFVLISSSVEFVEAILQGFPVLKHFVRCLRRLCACHDLVHEQSIGV